MKTFLLFCSWLGRERLLIYSSHFYEHFIFQNLELFYYFNMKQISKCTCKEALYVTVQTDLLLTTFPFPSEGSLSLAMFPTNEMQGEILVLFSPVTENPSDIPRGYKWKS